ncbi:MAG: c-type cytochrome biogenesis protein CcmI [Burkholderiaceae bacterium]|nr:c-type cytochrome biogenesis protein CcmI [Burkholderiaceae bacterium]
MSFLIVVSLLAVLAAVLLAWPLLRSRATHSGSDQPPDTDRERRLAVYRDRKLEIETDREAGRLNAAEAERAQNELIDEVSREFGATALESAAADSGVRPRPWLAIGLSALVAVITMLLYQQVGVPTLGLNPSLARPSSPDAEMDKIFAQLEERTRSNPDDGAAWVSLAEGRMGKGDFQQAASAYQQAVGLLAPDARLLADYAEALALTKNGDLSGEPTEQLLKAQAINPKDPKVLSLLASAQYQQRRLPEARRLLMALFDVTTPGGEQAKRIEEAIAQVDREITGGSAAKPQPAAQAAAAPSPPKGAAAPGNATVAGTVEIAPYLRAKLPPGATLVVFARAPEGSRMPYAVQALGAARFPAKFEMSDAQSMTPDRLLSSAPKLVIEARVSLTGGVMPKPGDLFGVSATTALGSDGLKIVIDKVVP